MIYIPGFLIGWVTFPGVIVHEFAHKKACEWRGVPVRDVNYFSLSGGGRVTHGQPRSYSDLLAISTAPFVVNSTIAFVSYLVAIGLYINSWPFPGVDLASSQARAAALGIGWFAVSVGWHAIPSFGDAGNIWEGAKKNWRSSVLALGSIPLVFFLYIANILKYVWFDALYSLGLGVLAYVLLNSMPV